MDVAGAVVASVVEPVVPANSNSNSAPTRLYGLDRLRILAALLVVLVHASIPYMTNPLPYLVWPARDAHPSAVVDAVAWSSACFLMPLFYVVAGYLSYGMLAARGERQFFTDRTWRIWWTSVAASLTVLPLCLCIWSLGWVADGLYVPTDIFNTGLPAELEGELYGLGHIWFLQYLYIYCLILCGTSWMMKRRFAAVDNQQTSLVTDVSSRLFHQLNRFLASVWKPLLPAIPCALILYWDPRSVLGFYQSFFPVLPKLIYHSVFFAAGVLMARQCGDVSLRCRFGKSYLLVGILLFVVLLPEIHKHLAEPRTGARLAYLASLVALFASFTTFGLFATFVGAGWGKDAITRYLADASFWVYLVHLPFVVLTQIAIASLPVPALCKFLVSGATALAISLMTYEVWVRDTWLGDFLNGYRRKRPGVKDGAALAYGSAVVVSNRMSNPAAGVVTAQLVDGHQKS